MTTIEGPTGSHDERGVKEYWPVEEGTTAATTKQTGSKRLHPEKASLVSKDDEVGMG